MFEQNIVEHNIQKHILQILNYKEYAKFSEMRPEKTDSNLYSYHLNKIISSGYVIKTDMGYTLSHKGLRYVEYTSGGSMKIRKQPKITTAVLLKNIDGAILLTTRNKQPYINFYGLPLGKTHSEKDKTILDAARRELYEKTGVKFKKLAHVGDMYLKIYKDDILISDLLVHAFSARCNRKFATNESSIWLKREEFGKVKIVPGAMEIINSIESGERFFKEISVRK